ncbi:MAG: dienelactone hydrolase [Akkermansiaceae bacterium]|nr:dienelactone hydrolase [Akkermansiaceae bacterium]
MKSLIVLLSLASVLLAEKASYVPTASKSKVPTELCSFSYNGREVPLKIYLPTTGKPAPLILLSHGLGGSREVGTYLGERWAGAGYVVVAMQHAGSDEEVWKKLPLTQRKQTLARAANIKTFLARMKDVPATLDQLERWNVEKKHILEKRIDMEHIGIAGHSYGAVTTQAIAGQSFGPMGPAYLDKRIDAGFAMSPSIPRRGSAEKAFAGIAIPMLLMTGTKDGNFITNAPPASRRGVFAALPPSAGNARTKHYELVLKDAEHSAFSDHRLRGEGKHNPNHHRVIKAISTAFWDSALKGNSAASEWLNGKGPYTCLQNGDLWQCK